MRSLPADPAAEGSPAPTTTQTIGPFPHEAWRWAFDPAPAEAAAAGALVIRGRVFDGSGAPVTDALLEAWSPADAGGPLGGVHRVPTDDDGAFRFALAARPAAGEPAAHVTLFARGLLKHQFTAVFLADDPAAATAPLLQQVPADRRATLLAQPDGSGHCWDVRLQGPGETVFFDYAGSPA